MFVFHEVALHPLGLRFFQDLSVADTAKILGKESITIRVWQHRAMKQLKKLFKQTNRNERTT
jgi:DNA-directed RNA polymerase specialized sigma24 family protein